jgi:hypothetical protein
MPYPLYRRLDGPQGRSGRVRKISPPRGFDPWAFQPVASRYTDWAIPARICVLFYFRYLIKIPRLLWWIIPMNFDNFYIVCKKYFLFDMTPHVPVIRLAALWLWGRLSLQQKWVPELLHEGKSGRCVGPTNLLPSYIEVLEFIGVSISCST